LDAADLHAAAGGQNNDPHSGTGRGKANLWTPQNQITTTKALQILVEQLSTIQNVVGLELMNEPSNNDHLQAWYESIIDNLRGISNDLPIYISDAWDLNWYAPLVGKRQDFVVVDRHVYKCFTPEDFKLSGDEHAARMTKEIQPWLAKKSKEAKGSIVIGEWSAALNPASLRSKEAGEMDRQRRVFASAQLKAFEETCAGWFFWSYKHEKGWDAGWSLENATKAAIMPEWVGGKKRGNFAALVEHELNAAKKKALGNFFPIASSEKHSIDSCRVHRRSLKLLGIAPRSEFGALAIRCWLPAWLERCQALHGGVSRKFNL
jgi:glucan 1,3-beta-glucosidase